MAMIVGEGAAADALYSPAKPSLLFLWAGTNDSDDAPAIYANYQTYCAARRVAGFKVAVVTMLPRYPLQPANETRRLAFNALVRGGWAGFADALCDVGGDQTIAKDQSSLSNTTYYSTDQTHLITAGYGIVAGYAKTAIDTMLAAYP